MDHDKIYKPAFRLSGEVPANWLDGFMEQVNKDAELIRLEEIMKSLNKPKPITIELSRHDLFC